ncbi:MAG: FkbM family methyltransferase [Candidatus Scalindua sp.]
MMQLTQNNQTDFIESLISQLDLKQLNDIDSVIETIKERTIFIYGAGGFGREMYNLMSKYGIKPFAFLDKAAMENERLFDIPVYRADDQHIDNAIKRDAVVLLSIATKTYIIQSIKKFIENCGFSNIVDSQSIRAQLVYPDDCDDKIIRPDYFLHNKDKINRIAKIWSDEESLALYKSNLIAHITRNYDFCMENSQENQYFPQNIMMNKGYKRFVDCGGYVGDTLEELVKTHDDIEAIASFEPDSINYAKLSNVADKLKSQTKQIILFPCAVSNRAETLTFCEGIGSGQISTSGDSFAKCVSLDDSIMDFSPTFIKMDVEGAELNALEGTKNVISKSRPDLAICVYHNINHLWDIPFLLDSWNIDYHFYLRTYSSCTMETVLYATCNE